MDWDSCQEKGNRGADLRKTWKEKFTGFIAKQMKEKVSSKILSLNGRKVIVDRKANS